VHPALSVQIRVGFSHHTFTYHAPSTRLVTVVAESIEAEVLVANGTAIATAEKQLITKEKAVQTSLYTGSPGACRDLRYFSIERHELAKQLPEIIERRLPTRKCYFAKDENYFVVEANDAPGMEYRVFFDVRHIDGETNAVLLYVQSAYPANVTTAPGGKRKKVGFNVLVNCALQETRAVEPP
jgi:hypothetical protein